MKTGITAIDLPDGNLKRNHTVQRSNYSQKITEEIPFHVLFTFQNRYKELKRYVI